MLEDSVLFIYLFIYYHWVQMVPCKYTSSNDCSQTWHWLVNIVWFLCFFVSIPPNCHSSVNGTDTGQLLVPLLYARSADSMCCGSGQQWNAFKGRLSYLYFHSRTGGRCLRWSMSMENWEAHSVHLKRHIAIWRFSSKCLQAHIDECPYV